MNSVVSDSVGDQEMHDEAEYPCREKKSLIVIKFVKFY